MGLSLAVGSPALALSKHTFSTSFAGSGPTALTNPTDLAVDQSSGDLYVSNTPVNEQQTIAIDATAGTFTLSFEGRTTGPIGSGTEGSVLEQALASLSTVGAANLNVARAGPHVFVVEFGAAFLGQEQPLITADPSGLSGGASTVTITRSRPANSASDVEKFTSSGEFILISGKDVNANPAAANPDLCTADSADPCRHGSIGSAPGAFTRPAFLAVDSSGGPSNGDLYVGDPGDHLVSKFDPAGNLIAGWGSGGQLDGSTATHGPFYHTSRFATPGGIAVDPGGTLFVLAGIHEIFKFAPDGGFLANFKGAVELNGIAVDGGQYLYSPDFGGQGVWKYSPAGVEIGVVSKNELNPSNGTPLGFSLDAASRDLYVTRSDGSVQHFAGACNPTRATACTPAETFGSGELSEALRAVAIEEAAGTVYVADPGNGRIAVFTALPYLPDAAASATTLSTTSESLAGAVDPAAAGPISACQFEWGIEETYEEFQQVHVRWTYTDAAPCETTPPSALPYPAGAPTAVHAEATSGLTYGTTYHFRLFAANAAGPNPSFDQAFTTLPLAPAILATSASEVHADAAALHAQVNPNGGGVPYHTAYHFEYVDEATFQEDSAGGDGFQRAAHTPTADAGSAKSAQSLTEHLSQLAPATTYRYRVVATNASGTETGPTRAFTTLPFIANNDDPCANAHVRQQTSAGGLLDCRAYELVSAANAGGYDVESDLVAGQSPFAAYPEAPGRVLYGVHSGGIPGADHPTNHGLDPYIAARGNAGWSTTYVGVPADNPFSAAPFSSLPTAADSSLQTFAFGAPGGCSPCFEGGYTGIPLRRPNGELIQAMLGASGFTPPPSATTDGYIAKPLSADGSHLLFGSTTQFDTAGNSDNGNVSIYDRNLTTEETHVVSKSPTGAKLPCLQGTGNCHSPSNPNGIAALDISSDGSHILLAQKLSEDAEANVYWHLYMNVGDATKTIDLTSATTSGVLYAGMSSDGSRVFFTTRDPLATAANQDTDTSADLYQAEVSSESPTATLTRISTGTAGAGNTDSCNPVASIPGAGEGQHWNTVGPEATCGVLAIGGGGGVASLEGSIYFLSPEKLTSCECVEPFLDPVQNQPNLYLASPGAAPRFLATLAPDDRLVLDALKAAGARSTADFQLTPAGEFAAFPSTLPLVSAGEETAGHTEIYRYQVAGEALACVSCPTTGAAPEADSSLASNGLSLSADGRVFFTSADQLAATDTDNRKDAYQWEAQGTGNCQSSSPSFGQATGACQALISAGTSTFDSGLLGVGADGTDAYFFTRDSLAPSDQNGPTMKIYDARAQGGFPYEFPPVNCKASDECHGASSPAPPPLRVRSVPGTLPEEPVKCRRGFVLKHGKCVRKQHHKKKHHRRATHTHRGGKK